jgi:FAD/FMN-containing dehydrogenase
VAAVSFAYDEGRPHDKHFIVRNPDKLAGMGGRENRRGLIRMSTTDLDLIRGPVLRPGDPDYDAERAGYNLLVDHHPAIIVGATGPADVMAAVRFAAGRGMPVAVQATGHGVSIPADGAVFINTRRMSGIRVDPPARTARIEAGVRSGRLVHEAAAHGLAPLNGSAPEVGAVSYMLAGGVALLGRRFGYAADHVRQLDVVTADGALRQVSAESDPDLFWAMRGAGASFGVVTSMEMNLVPVERLYGGGLYFAAEATAGVLHAYREWTAEAPEEMASSVLLIQLPDIPDVPDALRGRYISHVRIAYTGPADQGERLIRPLRDVGPRLLDTVREMPYRDVGSVHHEPTMPVPFHSKSSALRGLDAAAVDALLQLAGPDARAPYLVELRHLGGALSRPPAVPAAAGRRDALFSLYSGSPVAPGELDRLREANRSLHQAMSRWGTGGACLNFLAGPDVTADEVRSAYHPADFARLGRLKAAHDPGNLFRFNRNIAPAR